MAQFVFLLMWVAFILLVNQLTREQKHRLGWTIAAGLFPVLLIVFTGRFAQMSTVIVLFIWAALVMLVNYLAREKKHRFGWTVFAGLFPIPTLIVFQILEAISHKRQEKLDAAAGKIPGGQLRS